MPSLKFTLIEQSYENVLTYDTHFRSFSPRFFNLCIANYSILSFNHYIFRHTYTFVNHYLLYILARHKIKLKCTLYIAFVKCCMFSIEFAVPLFQRHEKKKRWPQYKRQNFINNVIIVYDIDISPRVDIIYGGILIEVNGRLKKIIHFFIPHYFRKCRTV